MGSTQEAKPKAENISGRIRNFDAGILGRETGAFAGKKRNRINQRSIFQTTKRQGSKPGFVKLQKMLTRPQTEELKRRIFSIRNEEDFNSLALEIFRLHMACDTVYSRFVRLLHPGLEVESLEHYRQIPFLPIEFFKTRKIVLPGFPVLDWFQSSGTTSQGAVQSRHYLCDLSLYEHCFNAAFRLFWGEPADYAFLALLPNYMEQPHSSLIYMMKGLMAQSRQAGSGFYLHEPDKIAGLLRQWEGKNQKTMLFGTGYALLDLAESCPMPLEHTIVLETGGMKGRRREMPKEELHQILREAFGLEAVHSEYGMCELLSQAYTVGDGLRFRCPPWMKILIRQSQDPLRWEEEGRSGGINVIDLGNLFSCPFIATQDLGRILPDGCFEVLGRFDYSDIRGCNLMIE